MSDSRTEPKLDPIQPSIDDSSPDLNLHFNEVRRRIREAEAHFGRNPADVQLLAVSKTKPAEMIRAVWQLGQRRFGESYLQEAIAKQAQLTDLDIEWHFIGPMQSNKTREIAHHFSWVHSIDRLKIAQRLNAQRSAELPPLNVLLQVNISGEGSKSGVPPNTALTLAQEIADLPRLRLRGLMAVPAPCEGIDAQRIPFRHLHELLISINAQGFLLDTLSMGMTNDLEAAIAEGSNILRIGTAIFGAR